MPIGTNIDETETFQLKSLPPDGFVTLKRMSWGDKLKRQGMVSKMQVETRRGSKEVRGELDMMAEKTALFDFATCVVEHNITDASGRQLNFRDPSDCAALAGRIGEEISTYIDKMNNFEEEDEGSEEGNS